MEEEEFWNLVGFIIASEIRTRIIDIFLKNSMVIQSKLVKQINSDTSTVSNNLKALLKKKAIITMNPDRKKGKIYKINPELEDYRTRIEELVKIKRRTDE